MHLVKLTSQEVEFLIVLLEMLHFRHEVHPKYTLFVQSILTKLRNSSLYDTPDISP